MHKKTVIGNYKLNPATKAEVVGLAQALRGIDMGAVKVGCAPSFIHLDAVAKILTDSPIWLGVQDVSAYGATGAFTGDVSAVQVADLGAKFTLIGHSERRTYHQETNETLAKKIQEAYKANLVVVLCVGETKEQYDNQETLAVLKNQLSVLAELGVPSSHLLIAYEPVWAIGTGLTPTVAEVIKVHRYIKDTLTAHGLPSVCVLYGGSVNEKNAQDFANCEDIDGALVGGASLKIDSFATIVSAFAQY